MADDQNQNTINTQRRLAIRNGAFAVMIETPNQGPILMETEEDFSRDRAEQRMRELVRTSQAIRACVVKLEFITGNSALLGSVETTEDR